MSILAIDYGAKKIGLAKSDQGHTMALPLQVIRSKDKDDLLSQLSQVCQEHEIAQIIVGVPVSLSGGPRQENLLRQVDLANKHMQEVLDFVEWLKSNLHLPVAVEDERLSTKMANTLMKGEAKGQDDDAVAAMLILQNYLDRLKH